MHPLLQRFLAELGRPIAIFDLETTTHAATAANFGITEVAITRYEPTGEREAFSMLVNPENELSEQAREITGLDPAELAQQPNFDQAIGNFAHMLDNAVLVGFNIFAFDIPALLNQSERYGMGAPGAIDFIDLRSVWKNAGITENGKGRLEEVAAHFGVEAGQAHRAHGDVLTCENLLPEMLWHFGRAGLMSQQKEYFAAKQEALARRQERSAGNGGQSGSRGGDRDQQRQRAQNAVEVLLAAGASGGSIDVARLAADKANGVSASDLSFAASNLLNDGRLRPEQLRDADAQEWLSGNLAAIRQASPEGLLKPMFTEAQKLGAPKSVDYVQLRVALAEAGVSPRPSRGAPRP
jgi:DNA polymerase III epsilon subunit-like protein